MLSFKKKKLILICVLSLALIAPAVLIPSIRTTFLDTLKHPLGFITLLQQEAGAVISYHKNFIRNRELQKEVDLLRNKLNVKTELELENTRLKNMLSFKRSSTYKLIAARVIARSQDTWSSNIIIDKGQINGIRRGMPVITYLGLAGRIIEVGRAASKVLLISDPNLNISAMVGRSRQEGLVSGTLGSNLIMRYLPEDSDIKTNDAIITSGLSQIYAKGLLIGHVVSIGKEYSGLARYAVIKPAVNLFSLEEVLVIIQ